jgi:hypothetical protein
MFEPNGLASLKSNWEGIFAGVKVQLQERSVESAIPCLAEFPGCWIVLSALGKRPEPSYSRSLPEARAENLRYKLMTTGPMKTIDINQHETDHLSEAKVLMLMIIRYETVHFFRKGPA